VDSAEAALKVLQAMSDRELAAQIRKLREEQDRRKPVRKVPPEWAGIHDTKHSTLCLAAAVAGWGHSGYDLDEITEDEYLTAIDRAVALLSKITAKHGAEGKVVKVLVPTEDFMHAVIVTLPTKIELRADVARMTAQAEAGNQYGFRDEIAKMFASRMVWPLQASPEAVRLMDELPALFDQQYPKSYRAMIGLDQGAVRRKG
jgi:hypothetical protein